MSGHAARALATLIGILAVVPVAARADTMSTLGGPVMHSQRTHLIFWAPSGTGLSFGPGYEQAIETFLGRVAAASRSTGNIFGLMGQYQGPGGPAAYDSKYDGAVLDTDPLPTGIDAACTQPPPPPLGAGPGWNLCLDDAALQSEIVKVVTAGRLPVGPSDIYFLVLPDGFGSCVGAGPSNCALGGNADDGYCGYHADIGSAHLLYAVIPYNALPGHCRSDEPRPNASDADPAISTIAHEFAEATTDPLGDAWMDPDGTEIADICLSKYGPDLGGSGRRAAYNEVIDGGHYYLQDLWSNFNHACEPRATPDQVAIVAPRRALRDASVDLTAHAVAAGRKVVAYDWSFGDGRSGRGHRTAHVFGRTGTFKLVLTVQDSWGDRATAVRRIRITADPPLEGPSGRRGERR